MTTQTQVEPGAIQRLRKAMLGEEPFTGRFTGTGMLDDALEEAAANARLRLVERIKAEVTKRGTTAVFAILDALASESDRPGAYEIDDGERTYRFSGNAREAD